MTTYEEAWDKLWDALGREERHLKEMYDRSARMGEHAPCITIVGRQEGIQRVMDLMDAIQEEVDE